MTTTGCGSRRADLRYRAGLEAADADKPAEARAAWNDALTLAPHRAGLRTNLAAVEADVAVAKRLLDEELKANPGLAEAKFDRALLDARAGEWEKAENGFEALAAADPEAADLVALCRLATGKDVGDPTSAMPATTDLGRWVRARAAWARGDAAQAAAALAGTSDPLLADLRAVFLMRAGDPGAAIAAAHSQPLKDLARLAAHQAPDVAPAPPTEPAVPTPPELAVVALRVQAAIASQATAWADALAALDRAWALVPSPGLRVERALALAWLGRLPEARAEIAESLRALEQAGAPELLQRANAIQRALASTP